MGLEAEMPDIVLQKHNFWSVVWTPPIGRKAPQKHNFWWAAKTPPKLKISPTATTHNLIF
jgi:hypothetical protein